MNDPSLHNPYLIWMTLAVIIAGTVAGLAIIKMFVIPNRVERKNKEW